MSDQPSSREIVWRRILWVGVTLLALIGIISALGRTYSVATGGLSYRQISQLMPAPIVQEALDFERWFVSYPALTLLHVIPGGLLLALAPFQFSARIRNRHLRFHRWSGRTLVVSAFVLGTSGVILAAKFPYGGPIAAAAAFVAGTAFLVALVQAVLAIRRRDVAAHREWMIRMFALGLAIATIRVLGLLVGVILGSNFEKSAGAVFWIGWASTFAVAELWIRHTRAGRVVVAPAVRGIEELSVPPA